MLARRYAAGVLKLHFSKVTPSLVVLHRLKSVHPEYCTLRQRVDETALLAGNDLQASCTGVRRSLSRTAQIRHGAFEVDYVQVHKDGGAGGDLSHHESDLGPPPIDKSVTR